MYGQIISFLFLFLILYYAVMIFLDIQKAKAVKAAELEKNNEEEIDISDEASTFKPVMITREETPKNNSESIATDNGKENKPDNEVKTENTVKSEPDKQKSEKTKPDPPAQEKKPATEKSDRPTPEVRHEDKHKPAKASAEDHKAQDSGEKDSPKSPQSAEKPFRRPGYREAIMTGYIYAENLIQEANKLAETGEWDLGNVIHSCDNAA